MMKKAIILCSLCLLALAAKSDNGDMPNDTIFKYKGKVVVIKTVDDSLNIAIMSPSAETDRLLEQQVEPESSVMYDGANYSFAFSWQKKKRIHSHWTGFGMSFMNYDDDKIPNSKLKMSSSHNFSLNLFEYYQSIRNSNWLFTSGVGFEWSRYHFDSNAALTKQNGVTIFESAPVGVEYKSTKLLAYYVTIPLLLEYQIPTSRHTKFHISAGAVGFFKYYSKSQVKYYDTNNTKHVENKGRDLNIRPVDVKARLQVGFNGVSLYGYYSPFSMFDKDEGPDMKMYSVGLQIGF